MNRFRQLQLVDTDFEYGVLFHRVKIANRTVSDTALMQRLIG